MAVTLTTINKLPDLQKNLANLNAKRVLVGVPESNAARKTAGVNNAQLMYIHTNGSPARGTPARPVIEPALMANVQLFEPYLKAAVSAELEGNNIGVTDALTSAGRLGANAAIRWFTDPRNGWAPNTPHTIKRKGSDRPLIDTGALRASITYVVDEE